MSWIGPLAAVSLALVESILRIAYAQHTRAFRTYQYIWITRIVSHIKCVLAVLVRSVQREPSAQGDGPYVMAKSRDGKRVVPQLTELQGLGTLENWAFKMPREFFEANTYDGNVGDLVQGSTCERAVQHQTMLVQALRESVRTLTFLAFLLHCSMVCWSRFSTPVHVVVETLLEPF
jgi:hypothetical protein